VLTSCSCLATSMNSLRAALTSFACKAHALALNLNAHIKQFVGNVIVEEEGIEGVKREEGGDGRRRGGGGRAGGEGGGGGHRRRSRSLLSVAPKPLATVTTHAIVSISRALFAATAMSCRRCVASHSALPTETTSSTVRSVLKRVVRCWWRQKGFRVRICILV
jgi:hypothetical protein